MAKPGNAETSSSSLKLDRKTIEKNRRILMKSLCSKLFNLVPPSHFKISKELLSQQNQISYVIAYINELKERVKNLEKRKQALRLRNHSHNHDYHQANDLDRVAKRMIVNNDDLTLTLPVVELRDLDNDTVHIMLISSLNRTFMLHQIIGVVEEEGGEVVNASLSTIGNKVFYSLHIEAKISRVGIETSRIQQRLLNLVSRN
ncbi:unnamed protein product [Citrullus colocynthis]|uniref:BHLH domain-containing protein n=1 Tax=Citrullus colocynthis TaxID=252529 RepID=A0ABP0XYF0_9ROSI